MTGRHAGFVRPGPAVASMSRPVDTVPVVIRTMSEHGTLVTVARILPALQVPGLHVANADIPQP
jgi:hypothetical protein